MFIKQISNKVECPIIIIIIIKFYALRCNKILNAPRFEQTSLFIWDPTISSIIMYEPKESCLECFY
jgi:hypothetical protein